MSPPKRKHTAQMVAGLSLSGFAAAATTFAAVQKLVYTRQEGRMVEQRVIEVEYRYREDVKEIRARLDAILDAAGRCRFPVVPK